MECSYSTDETTGITKIVFSGEATVLMEERFDPKKGDMRYFVSNVRASQPNFKIALEWAARNAGLAAAHAEYNRQNPKSRKAKLTVDDFNVLRDKLAAYEARFGSIEELAEEVSQEEAPVKIKAVKKSA